jgi:NAD(P)-dependent dehydrogenase (short-subunit alcohol dehydrogenase family)
MVRQGARYLVFTSRSGAARPEAQKLLKELAEQGAKTKVFACDISNVCEFEHVLEHVTAEFPPIRGVITGAMQLQV